MEEEQKDRKRVNTDQGWLDFVSSFFKARVPLLWWAYVIAVLGVAIYLTYRYWEELLEDAGLARNLIFVVAALIGLPLAIWRSFVADRQSKTAQQQSETAQRSLLNERYQKGTEMLGSEVRSVRLGGIYALERLAREHAEGYHILIIKLFCAFVRQSESDTQEKHPKIREDVQAIMTALGRRDGKQREIEKQEIKISKEPILNLAGAKLPGAVLERADLSRAVLDESTDLSGAMLEGADLSLAELNGASLSGAKLDGTDLSGVTGLTQAQLDEAVADPDNPPDLTDAKDSETGKPLVWRGNAPPESSS